MERRKSATGVADAVRDILRSSDRPVKFNTIWLMSQPKVPHVDQKAVSNAVMRLCEQGEITRTGVRPNTFYQIKKEAPMPASSNGVHPTPVLSGAIEPSAAAILDRLQATKPVPAVTEPTPATLTPLPTARRIGGYSISTAAFLMADLSSADQVTIYTCVLEIDGATGKNKNKRLLFKRGAEPREYADTLRWIADMERGASDPDGATAAALAKAEQGENDALTMAEQMALELDVARAKIAELEAALAPLKALLGR